MATSVYFQNYNITGEQDLLHNLVMESIKIYGVDMMYIPRELKMYDKLYGEDAEDPTQDMFTDPKSFLSKKPLQRASILVAGVTMNFILALVKSVMEYANQPMWPFRFVPGKSESVI